jgi:hypothetical protein
LKNPGKDVFLGFIVFLGWISGFAATLGILAIGDYYPRLYTFLIYPIGKLTEAAGIGVHDLGIIPVILVISPMFYGSVILGSGYIILRIIRRIRGA